MDAYCDRRYAAQSAAAGMGHNWKSTAGRFKTDDQELQEAVKLLQEAGATINGHDRNGLTALHSAAEHGWNDTVKVLVADAAELQPKDAKGLTPIDARRYVTSRRALSWSRSVAKHDDAMELLKGYTLVAATGKAPIGMLRGR